MDSVLRGLEGYGDLADRLMDEYWIRGAEDAIRRERRDGSVASQRPGSSREGDEYARRLAAELVDDDYRSLIRSFRLAEAPARWEVDWQSEEFALVDLNHQVRRLRLNSFGQVGLREPAHLAAALAGQPGDHGKRTRVRWCVSVAPDPGPSRPRRGAGHVAGAQWRPGEFRSSSRWHRYIHDHGPAGARRWRYWRMRIDAACGA